MKRFSQLGISKPSIQTMRGDKIKVERVLNREITVHSYTLTESKYKGQLLTIQIEVSSEFRVLFTGSSGLIEQIQQVDPKDFPFKTEIIKETEYYEFT